MAKGGARAGSGRKQGTANIKTREVADDLAKSGKKTPLEVMLEAMHFAMEQCEKTSNVLEKKIFYESAHAHAKDAAPYIHAKLASVEVKNPEGETFRTSQEISVSDKELIERALKNKGAK